MVIFSIDRITIYNRFDAWEASRFAGLYDKKRYGRPPKLTVDEQEKVQHYLEHSPPYTFFLLNDDMKLNRNRQFLV